jgi:hypothetical protein
VTTVAQIIDDAFRASNLVAVGASPNTNQQAEALRYLSRIVKSVFGNEAGEEFMNLPIGRTGIERPAGYPWYGDNPDGEWYIPENTRLMVNLEASTELFLHPAPDDGSRFAVIDVAQNFDTATLTISGNGRRIDGQTSVTLDTPGLNQEWFYRGDIGEWVSYAPIDINGVFPFPEEFDEFFITMLALRINPSYGTMMDSQTQEVMRRSKAQLRARYSQTIFMPVERGLLRMPLVSAARRAWTGDRAIYDPNAMFDKGWPS